MKKKLLATHILHRIFIPLRAPIRFEYEWETKTPRTLVIIIMNEARNKNRSFTQTEKRIK